MIVPLGTNLNTNGKIEIDMYKREYITLSLVTQQNRIEKFKKLISSYLHLKNHHGIRALISVTEKIIAYQ